MKNSLMKFILQLVVLTAVAIPVNYYVNHEFLNMEFEKLYYFSYFYFFLVTIIIHLLLKRSLKDRPQKYVVVFMASMGIKIFLSLMILVVVLLIGIENSKVFAINYLILYMLYSAFSVSRTLKSLKNLPQQGEKSS